MTKGTTGDDASGEVAVPVGSDAASLDVCASELVERVRAEGVALTGDGGLLTDLMRHVLQRGLEVELRKVVYNTNAIESLNARFRRSVRHRGHFPNEQAALKVLYLVATQRRPNRQDLTGRINGWKTILNALTVLYGDRIADHVR